jgi:outer membrane immunogenic protein
MSRRSFAAAAALVAAFTTPALAADMYGGAQPAPSYGYTSPTPAANWNGAYVGGHVGHGWGPEELDGTQAGIYGGINTTVGSNVVVGVEGDLNISGQKASHLLGGKMYQLESDWNGTIRPRVGIAFDKIMPYATGGIAFADDTARTTGSTSSTTKMGYAIGAGVEAQVADHISVKGEYMHLGYGRTDHNFPGRTINTSIDTNLLRGGVAYRF